MSQKYKLPRTHAWGMGLGLNRVVCEFEKKKTGTEMKKDSDTSGAFV